MEGQASASKSSVAESSSAVASRVWNRAARVAVRRGSCSAARLAGLAVRALRASRPSGAVGKSTSRRKAQAVPANSIDTLQMPQQLSVGERRFGVARKSSSVLGLSSSDVTNATSFWRWSSVRALVRRCQSRNVAR